MRNGKRLKTGCVNLESARKYTQQQIARLPNYLCAITQAKPPYPVEISQELSLFQQKVKAQVASD
jgi:nicotinate phosphoribosyltransferase